MKRKQFIPQNVRCVFEPAPEYVLERKAQFFADFLMEKAGEEARKLARIPEIKLPDLSFLEENDRRRIGSEGDLVGTMASGTKKEGTGILRAAH